MATRVLAAALLIVVAPLPLAAQEPSLRWSYSRGRGAEGCPDEPSLRRAITAQLGRDPFADDGDGDGDARDAVALDVRRAKKQLRARIELREEDGAILGARELRGNDCAELAPAMTLAIAMAIDALAGPRPPATPPPATQLASAAPPPAPAAVTQALDGEVPTLERPPKPRLAWDVSVGLLGAVDATTLAAVGLTVEADLVRSAYSVGVELRGDLPASANVGSASINASLWTGSVVPCLRHKFAALCALASLGAEKVDVNLVSPYMQQLSMTRFWLGLGVRMALELPVHKRLALRLHADVIAPVLRHQLPSPGDSASGLYYITPPVSSSFGAALLAIFP